MRSRSSWSTAGSVYQLQGSVLVSTALTRRTVPSATRACVRSRSDDALGQTGIGSRAMTGRAETSAEALVTAVEEQLRAALHARAAAWWDSQVDATDENERDACRDRARLVGRARGRASSSRPSRERSPSEATHGRRRSSSSANLMLTHQVPGEPPLADRRARGVGRRALLASSRRRRRRRGGRQRRSSGSSARATTSTERREAWEASKTVGAAVADDVRELARLRNEAARSLGLPRLVRALARDGRARRGASSSRRSPRRIAATAEPFARWKSRARRHASRRGSACSTVRSAAVALRRSVLPGDARRTGAVDLDPLFEGKDVVALSRRTFEGVGLEVDGHPRAQRSLPARRQEPARVLHRHRPRR